MLVPRAQAFVVADLSADAALLILRTAVERGVEADQVRHQIPALKPLSVTSEKGKLACAPSRS